MWKAIIIEDEPLARQRLKRMLAQYDDIQIVAEAENGAEGLKLCDKLKPELIFLDIEMPILNGFEMLARLTHQPKVIFTTAYDQYAIKAFEEGSIDYLLKPIETERLNKTIKKLRNTQINVGVVPNLDELIRQIEEKKVMKTLTVKLGDRILLIRLDEILHIQAEDKYVFLHTSDGKKHLTDYTLAVLEEKLPEEFIRVHRGDIINTSYIKEIRKTFNSSLVFVLNHNPEIKVSSSRSYGEELRGRFGI